jgi:hypothetical protein
MKTTLQSTGAVLAGIIAVFALSTITDLILETTGVMKLPFAGKPLWLMIAVTAYRSIYVISSSYITAKSAPVKPMKYTIIFGAIDFVLGTIGTIIMRKEPPHW